MNRIISDYQRLLPFLPVVVGFLLLYFEVIQHMVQDWQTNDNYSHGFLIPIITGYLIWQRKDRLQQLNVSPSNTGLMLLLLSLVFFVITNIGAELFTMRFSMILVILSLTIFFAGWETVRIIFLPVSYLVFMIPFPAIIWNKIAFPLKLFATQMAVSIIKLINIPVYGEGNIIHLANTTLEVVDACSGLRSLTSLIALSAALALISTLSSTKKIVIFISAFPIAIILNVLRLTSTAILARYFGPEVAQGFLHDASGVIVFIFAFFALLGVNQFLESVWKDPPNNSEIDE